MKQHLLNRFLFMTLGLAVCCTEGAAQSTTNIGTEFWIAFPPNSTITAVKQLYISSVFATSGMIESAFPGVDQSFSVTPGTVTQITLPTGIALQGGTEDKGIHITSEDPIAVYGLNNQTASTDAFLALPVNALGLDYRILTYATTLNNNGSAFSIVAVQDGTALTVFNHQTGITTNLTLNMGQTYHVEAVNFGEDLTGSRIQSNFPVAVFGSVKLGQVPPGCSFADHCVEQVFPYYSWGKNFVTVPLAGRDESGDVFRILAATDGTEIEINGTLVATINEGDYFETTLAGYNSVSASRPAMLGQFAKGQNCSGGSIGDPFMMLILPREQYLTDYTIINVAGVTPFISHWVNLVAPDYALDMIYQDGVLVPSSSFVQIGSTNYYGARISVTQGSHTFTSVFPFGVSVYGWRSVDSYGYPGGGSMSPVVTVDSVSLSPDTLYGDLNITNLCLTAHVQNNLGNPVEGVLVNFYISGINPLVGNAYTNAAGDAQYCYTQTGSSSGIDYVYAEVFGLVSDTSVIFWTSQCSNPVQGGTVGENQTGCGEFLPATLVNITLPSGETGTLEYKWQQSLVSDLTGFTDIAGTNSPGYTPGPVTQTTWFRRLARVTCMSDWVQAAISNVLKMTVIQPLPVSVTIVASDTAICEGTAVTVTATPVNGGASPAFQWYRNGLPVGPNHPVYTYTPVDDDSLTCTVTSSELCTTNNPATSNALTMEVEESPVVSFTPCFDTITVNGARPIRLKGGIPSGGAYTGAGVSGGYYDPALAGPGTHVITYTYTNIHLCSASAGLRIHQLNSALFACGDDLTDPRDNTVYPTVQIGTQCWMSANLNYGMEISSALPQRDNCIPENYTPPASYVPPPSFYQWDELMQYDDTPGGQGLCPPGWHVPTEAEWNSLFANWSNNGYAGSPLKYTGYSGFNAVLPGVRHQNREWNFPDFATFLWSSTPHGPHKAWSHGLNDPDPSVSLYPSLRSNAFSVRCLMD